MDGRGPSIHDVDGRGGRDVGPLLDRKLRAAVGSATGNFHAAAEQDQWTQGPLNIKIPAKQTNFRLCPMNQVGYAHFRRSRKPLLQPRNSLPVAGATSARDFARFS